MHSFSTSAIKFLSKQNDNDVLKHFPSARAGDVFYRGTSEAKCSYLARILSSFKWPKWLVTGASPRKSNKSEKL